MRRFATRRPRTPVTADAIVRQLRRAGTKGMVMTKLRDALRDDGYSCAPWPFADALDQAHFDGAITETVGRGRCTGRQRTYRVAR